MTSDAVRRFPGLGRLAGRLALLGGATLLALAPLETWLGGRVYGFDRAMFERVRDVAQPLSHVIIGPSQAHHGLDPRHLPGPPFTNLGLEGAGPGYLRRWYAHYRTYQPAPASAIMVVPWYMLRRGCLWRRFEQDAMYLRRDEALALAREPGTALDVLAYNRFALTKYHLMLLAGVPAGLGQPAPWDGRGYYPYRGFPIYDWTVDARFTNPVDPAEEAAYDALLGALRADGARVAQVFSPMYAATRGLGAADEARLAAIAARHGIPTLGWRDGEAASLAAVPENFLDWHHLNEQGSQRWSRLVAQGLARIGFFAK